MSSLWFCERDFAHFEHVLPSGKMQLLISLSSQPIGMHPLTLTGPKTSASLIDTRAMARLVGVQFRFGGAFPFLGLPCTEVLNQDLDLGLVWGEEAEGLRSRLGELSDPRQILGELEAHLQVRLGAHLPDVNLARACTQLADGHRVSQVVHASGLSRGTLVRRIRIATGLPPKRIAQLSRFQRAIRKLAEAEDDLVRLAQEVGYYDQSHLTREFRRFSGRTPTEYRPRSGQEPNHAI